MLEIEVTPRGVRLAGEVDVSNVDSLVDALDGTVGDADGDVSVDLSGLTFIESSGVRALLDAARHLEGRGRLVLRAPRRNVGKLFDLMGVGRVPNVEISPG